jgi:hypothetical protein
MSKLIAPILSILLLCSTPSYAGVTGQFIEVILKKTGFTETMASRGIPAEDADEFQGIFLNSLRALNPTGDLPTKTELEKILASLGELPEHSPTKARLTKLFSKEANQITKQEIVDATNDIVDLASLYGIRGSDFLACTASCDSKTLSKYGVKYNYKKLTNAALKNVSERVPTGATAMKSFISKKHKKIKGSVNFSAFKYKKFVEPQEERNFAMLLELADPEGAGTPELKELAQNILENSKDSKGKIDLFSLKKGFSHKLWKILGDDMSPELIKEWNALLAEVAAAGGGKKAFFKALDKRALGNPELKERVAALRAKGCYYK